MPALVHGTACHGHQDDTAGGGGSLAWRTAGGGRLPLGGSAQAPSADRPDPAAARRVSWKDLGRLESGAMTLRLRCASGALNGGRRDRLDYHRVIGMPAAALAARGCTPLWARS